MGKKSFIYTISNESAAGCMGLFYNRHPRFLEVRLKRGDKMWGNGCWGKMGLLHPSKEVAQKCLGVCVEIMDILPSGKRVKKVLAFS